jgi:hypothetical protein
MDVLLRSSLQNWIVGPDLRLYPARGNEPQASEAKPLRIDDRDGDGLGKLDPDGIAQAHVREVSALTDADRLDAR